MLQRLRAGLGGFAGRWGLWRRPVLDIRCHEFGNGCSMSSTLLDAPLMRIRITGGAGR
ncbi:hypothetical protein [Mycobacterium asiaticum]|uniref:hypothetical protein n=1 Tax=Mycobacterium asiaticum TaxID=1790 RepID=UPI001FCFFE08|nr:hypothetical protein [Mycobacterium asiaticum]